MSERKTEFWWASIHGADPEPVEKTEHDGRPCVYTLGCADPFYLDEDRCAVNVHLPMVRPMHPDREAAELAGIAADRDLSNAAWRDGRKTYVRPDGKRAPAVHHGWRGPR